MKRMREGITKIGGDSVVYVRGFGEDVELSEISQFFSEYGEVEDVVLRGGPQVTTIILP